MVALERWLLVVAALVAARAECARILAVLPVPAPSHMIAYTALTRALAERGHLVTLVCAFPQQKNHPNQQVVVIGTSATSAEMLNTTRMLHEDFEETIWKQLTSLEGMGIFGRTISTHALEHPEVQKILQQPAGAYDAIIIETFLGQEVFIALGHKFNAPVITVQSHGDIADLNYVVGAPTMPSYKPFPYIDVKDEMDFDDRFKNAIFTYYYLYLKWFREYSVQQTLVEKYFPNSPPFLDLLHNISLTVVNSHPTLCYPAPTPPNVVYAGGMHINHTPKPLPEGLKEFMDGAKNGVVYFSMGTLLKASDMTDEQKSMFIETFRSLKQRVLVKWNADPPANLPSNVRLEEWIPQADILAHPNTRLFITHGGLLGTQEAVYHGVPVIGIPKFGDQMFNIQLACRKGYGLRIDFLRMSKELIEWSVNEVLSNPKYTLAARKLSQLFRGQPLKPVDNAVFWVEHVMEHGGQHLRPASLKLSWYQYFLLDILLVVLLPVIVFSVLVAQLVCKMSRKFFGKGLKDKKKKTN